MNTARTFERQSKESDIARAVIIHAKEYGVEQVVREFDVNSAVLVDEITSLSGPVFSGRRSELRAKLRADRFACTRDPVKALLEEFIEMAAEKAGVLPERRAKAGVRTPVQLSRRSEKSRRENPARLKSVFENEIKAKLQAELKLGNIMEVPKLRRSQLTWVWVNGTRRSSKPLSISSR